MSSRSRIHSHYTILTETGIKEQSGCGETRVTHCVPLLHRVTHLMARQDPRQGAKNTALCQGPRLCHAVQQDSPEDTAEEVAEMVPRKPFSCAAVTKQAKMHGIYLHFFAWT